MVCTGHMGDRGASEVLGFVLLVGIVALGTIVVLLSGTPGIETIQSQTDTEQAETRLQELDSQLASVTASNSKSEARVDLGEMNPSKFEVADTGWMNVTVNKNESCATDIRMSSVTYEDDETEVGYQAGGVWNRFESNGTTMVSEPAVAYRNDTIEMDITNVTGRLDKRETKLVVTDSSTPSDGITEGDCVRPDNVTIEVQSRYYEAWGRYLRSEFGSSVTTYQSNRTAVLYLPQSELPERADDEENNVVNLSSSSATVNSDGISFDKGAGNRYTVTATPVGNDTIDIGETETVRSREIISGPPNDVVLSISTSGSMQGNKLTQAKSAAKRFVGQLNESGDRVALVPYNSIAYYKTGDNNRYFFTDFDEANESIDSFDATKPTRWGPFPEDPPDVKQALRGSNDLLVTKSNRTRDRAIVLLTDGIFALCAGETSDDDPYDCRYSVRAIDYANFSAKQEITVYTVDYGDDGDKALLKEIANQTGGSYYTPTSGSELKTTFDDIRSEITRLRIVKYQPIASNYTTESGEVYAPGSAADLDDVATERYKGTEFTNINDPTVGAQLSHSFAVTDGEGVQFRVHDFECADDGLTGTDRYERRGGVNYEIVRCTDIKRTEDTISPSGIYLDGDNIDSLLTEETAWWQADINDTLDQSGVDVCQQANCDGGRSFGDLALDSNQALVYYDLPDGTNSNNRLFMLYEIGIAESDAPTEDIINIEVNNVTAAP